MGGLKLVILAAMLAGFATLVACNDNDEDETQKSKSPAAAAAQPAPQKPEGKDADEDEAGVSTPGAVAAERPAPVQAAGAQFVYNFDNNPAGPLPAKFHSARTGQGSEGKWAVMADKKVPSKPNVGGPALTGKTDYRFPLLISEEGALRDLAFSVRFKWGSGGVGEGCGLVV